MHMAEAGHRVQHEEHHKDEEEDLVADVKRCEVVQHLSPLTMCETHKKRDGCTATQAPLLLRSQRMHLASLCSGTAGCRLA